MNNETNMVQMVVTDLYVYLPFHRHIGSEPIKRMCCSRLWILGRALFSATMLYIPKEKENKLISTAGTGNMFVGTKGGCSIMSRTHLIYHGQELTGWLK